MRLYRVQIRPVLMCGSGTWIISKSDEREMQLFVGKFYRRIVWAKLEGQTWRCRHKQELYRLSVKPNIIQIINFEFSTGLDISPE